MNIYQAALRKAQTARKPRAAANAQAVGYAPQLQNQGTDISQPVKYPQGQGADVTTPVGYKYPQTQGAGTDVSTPVKYPQGQGTDVTTPTTYRYPGTDVTTPTTYRYPQGQGTDVTTPTTYRYPQGQGATMPFQPRGESTDLPLPFQPTTEPETPYQPTYDPPGATMPFQPRGEDESRELPTPFQSMLRQEDMEILRSPQGQGMEISQSNGQSMPVSQASAMSLPSAQKRAQTPVVLPTSQGSGQTSGQESGQGSDESYRHKTYEGERYFPGPLVTGEEPSHEATYEGHTGVFFGSDGYTYDFATAPDEVLLRFGYYRAPDGTVWHAPGAIPPELAGTTQFSTTGDLKEFMARRKQRKSSPEAYTKWQQAIEEGETERRRRLARRGGDDETTTEPKMPYQPTYEPKTPYQPTYDPPGATMPFRTRGEDEPREIPTPFQPTTEPKTPYQPTTDPPGPKDPTTYQKYLDQWEYGPAPEWEDTEYKRKRDAALQRAEDMKWDYDPDTDPVWQAYQKQYRREGQRATQDAMGAYASMTGGMPSSYAVTAASQAGNYYASQLSDKLPELYQSAYDRYLQEFQKQLGLSEEYAGFDDREYDRYRDRLSQYGRDRDFEYGRYRDALGDSRYDDETRYSRGRDALLDQRYDQEWAQKMREYADTQGWKQKEWEQYLREYGDQLSEQEKKWAYQMARDAKEDERYEREYGDTRRDKDWQKELTEREYEDEREQRKWDREYTEREYDDTRRDKDRQRELAEQEYEDEREQQAWEREYKQTAYEEALRQTALDELYARGYVTGPYAEILGVPEGTTREQYEEQYGYTAPTGTTGGYTGGGRGTGGGGSSKGSSTTETAPAPTGSGQKSGNYDSALTEIRDYQQDHSSMETLQKLREWVVQGYLTDEEANRILRELGYGTGGGGSYTPPSGGSPSVQMTK